MITSRRGLITGLGALLAAPAIVRASSLMPVSSVHTLDWYELPSHSWYSGPGYAMPIFNDYSKVFANNGLRAET